MKKLLLVMPVVCLLFASCEEVYKRDAEMSNQRRAESPIRTLTKADSLMLVSIVDASVDRKTNEVRDKLVMGSFFREAVIPEETILADYSAHENVSQEFVINLNTTSATFLKQDLLEIADAFSEGFLKENFEYVRKSGKYKLVGGQMNFDAGQFVIIQRRQPDSTSVELYRAEMYYGDGLSEGESYVTISTYDTDPKTPAKEWREGEFAQAKKKLEDIVLEFKELIAREGIQS